jgi:hypothetical protein
VEEGLETDPNHNSSSAATNDAIEENKKNMYNIPTSKKPFETLGENGDLSTSSKISPNQTIIMNPDLKQNLSSSSVSEFLKSSNTTDPNIADQEDSRAKDEENLDLENEDEDFSHLSYEEQAILNQISRIIRGPIATTQPTTQNNLKQLLLGWYYYR